MPMQMNHLQHLHLKLQPILLLAELHSSGFIQAQIEAGNVVLNANTNKRERICRIMQMHANKQKSAAED